MRTRSILLGALVAAGVIVIARRLGRPAPTASTAPRGWATCSAPSARVYDLTFGWLLGGLYRRMAADLAIALDGTAAPAVLEVGPGPGGLAVELARLVPGLQLTGVDIDPEMVARAEARARRERLSERVRFQVGDVGALPFPDGCFDLVTSSFSVHHWPDAIAGFAEIRRVLRAGGRAIVYDLPDTWGHLETKAPPLGAAAAGGGFGETRVDALPWPGPVAFVRRLEARRDG